MSQRVIVVVSDLLFQSRIEGAAKSLGLEPVIADTPQRLAEELSGRPAIAVVDVHETAFSALDAISSASGAGVRVLAFGRHTAPAELRSAREAGAAIVVPRSELVERLPEFIERLLPAAGGSATDRDSPSL